MNYNQSSEDYLESILLLSRENEFVHRVDVARKTGVSQPAVQKAIKLLQTDGLVECDGLHIYLTQKGEERATRIYEGSTPKTTRALWNTLFLRKLFRR